MSGIKYSKLRGKIAECGLTNKELAQKIGISQSALSYKMNGLSEFKASEIMKISKALGIEDIEEYFFNEEVLNIEH